MMHGINRTKCCGHKTPSQYIELIISVKLSATKQWRVHSCGSSESAWEFYPVGGCPRCLVWREPECHWGGTSLSCKDKGVHTLLIDIRLFMVIWMNYNPPLSISPTPSPTQPTPLSSPPSLLSLPQPPPPASSPPQTPPLPSLSPPP